MKITQLYFLTASSYAAAENPAYLISLEWGCSDVYDAAPMNFSISSNCLWIALCGDVACALMTLLVAEKTPLFSLI